MDRKGTRHNWCALRKFSKSGKVDLPLFDLHDLLFSLALIYSDLNFDLGQASSFGGNSWQSVQDFRK